MRAQQLAGASSGLLKASFTPNPAASSSPSLPPGTRPSSQQLQPAAATPGLPPIRHAAVLTDRRHVLTQDAGGRVELWDVTSGGSEGAGLGLGSAAAGGRRRRAAGRRLHSAPLQYGSNNLAVQWCDSAPLPGQPALALAPTYTHLPPPWAALFWLCGPGAVVRDYGPRELKEVERQLFEPSQSVSAWFAPEVSPAWSDALQGACWAQQRGWWPTRWRCALRAGSRSRRALLLPADPWPCRCLLPQVKLGSLAGSMEVPACFGAEIYAQVRALGNHSR